MFCLTVRILHTFLVSGFLLRWIKPWDRGRLLGQTRSAYILSTFTRKLLSIGLVFASPRYSQVETFKLQFMRLILTLICQLVMCWYRQATCLARQQEVLKPRSQLRFNLASIGRQPIVTTQRIRWTGTARHQLGWLARSVL